MPRSASHVPSFSRHSSRGSTNRSKGDELLLEVGTEELPSHFILPALQSLYENADRLLKDQRLVGSALHTYGTPRRLVLVIDRLSPQQLPARIEVIGPPQTVAFAPDGTPTQAAIGFARSQGVDLADLRVRETPKGRYVCAVKEEPGRPTAETLVELLAGLIRSLAFPKSMRWNETGFRFARPIRWILATYAGRVVDLTIAGVRSGNRTWGHRSLGKSTRANRHGFTVSRKRSYLQGLEQHGVIVDHERRRTLIRDQLTALAHSVAGTPALDENAALLEQAVFSVEYPWTILGRFDPRYLALPHEVLTTTMEEHQGFFPLRMANGALLPHFLSVTNSSEACADIIRQGNERVLAARLADARFYYDADRKIALADRVDGLQDVTFHQKLGTLFQKTERVRALAGHLAERLGQEDVETCRRAAFLSKADLLTGMVGEFPTLQGIMGREYARHDGEPEAVCQAIGEHYRPRSMDDRIPFSSAGSIVSLADRIDTLSAFFRVGLLPSGSEDPYALRRNAVAVVRILVERSLPLNLGPILALAHELLASQGIVQEPIPGFESDPEAGVTALIGFLSERVRYYARTVHAFREDVMDAVLAPVTPQALTIMDLLARMDALQEVTKQPGFDPLMVGFRRANRLVEKENWRTEEIEPSRFEHPAEHALHAATQDAKRRLPSLLAARDYRGTLEELVRLKPCIDEFFEGVLVNAEDAAIRANRLSLLYAVAHLFASFADFSRIQSQSG